jgi:glutamine amidotransferase
MKIIIINYGAGNVKSVQFALEKLGYPSIFTNDPVLIQEADKVIFPGVGEASSAMKQLTRSGLDKIISVLKQPVLGICLGMQLMCNHSEEGNSQGLDIFPLKVVQFNNELKVPHMGWNTINKFQSILFNSINNDAYVYFVHSYYVPVSEYSIAQSNYGVDYSAAITKDNFYACQFHPEKSGGVGEQILKNFLEL